MEWPRLVATLMRDVGDLTIAEDAAQDAFLEAARRWPAEGVPDRPGAWLVTTGRRKAIDQIRRMRRFEDRLPVLAAEVTTVTTHGTASADDGLDSQQALDDQLALLVGCCHPALAPEAQVALTLRIVAGLSTPQIARAFLISEETMTRRLTRAKAKVRDARIPFDPPDLAMVGERVGAVCEVISSIFTEGHASATDTALIRGDLCEEAIWLAELLSTLVPTDPEVAGLHALLLLTDARRPSRLDDHGRPILLADQDRALWDQPMIARGLAELARAHSFHRGGPFQFQAAIAALHATAPTFDATDWPGVLRLYDVLLQRQPERAGGAEPGHRRRPRPRTRRRPHRPRRHPPSRRPHRRRHRLRVLPHRPSRRPGQTRPPRRRHRRAGPRHRVQHQRIRTLLPPPPSPGTERTGHPAGPRAVHQVLVTSSSMAIASRRGDVRLVTGGESGRPRRR